MSIDILHGFLGRRGDWSFFKKSPCCDLFSDESIKCDSLESWGEWFGAKSSSEILLGYSLGGRLALHALLQSPNKWKGAVIISAHPGLQSIMERKMRLERDQAWAKRWITDPWESVVSDWNQQAVFSHDPTPDLTESDFDRQKLYRAMIHWSLGHQEDLRKRIAELDIPILWVVGEKDEKFRKLAESVTLSHANSKFWIAPQVGHRVHLGQQERLVKRVHEFEELLS